MFTYICKFSIMGGEALVHSTGGIADFYEGFWVNSDDEFTKGSDACIWIPPAAIKFVAKLPQDPIELNDFLVKIGVMK